MSYIIDDIFIKKSLLDALNALWDLGVRTHNMKLKVDSAYFDKILSYYKSKDGSLLPDRKLKEIQVWTDFGTIIFVPDEEE